MRLIDTIDCNNVLVYRWPFCSKWHRVSIPFGIGHTLHRVRQYGLKRGLKRPWR